MLYGSWRIINDRNQLLQKQKEDIHNVVDLLAFCIPEACKKLSPHCTVVESVDTVAAAVIRKKATCWAIIQPVPTSSNKISYNQQANSYVMFSRMDIHLLKPRYKYLLRTNVDVFISPTLFWFQTNETLLFGKNYYSTSYNTNKLKGISEKLGLVHGGIQNISSTWFGDTSILLQAGKKMDEVVKYLLLNEFHPEQLKELEKGPTKIRNRNPDGIWPDWYKPAVALYAGQMVLNDILVGNTTKFRTEPPMSILDTYSDEYRSIWTTLHIHSEAGDKEFSRKHFQSYLEWAFDSIDGEIGGETLHRLIGNVYPRDISRMNIKEYCIHVAWNSAGRFLQQWLGKESRYQRLLSRLEKNSKAGKN